MNKVTDIFIHNATVIPPECDTIPTYWGYITAAIAVLFYGTMYVPVKKYETGDGLFYQWIMCNGAFLVGIIIQLIRGAPDFFPLAMIGGVIFVSGNMCVVPIIKSIGLGLGMCIWGVFNLLSGWATGRFGLFGVKAEVPDKLALNYVGVALAAVSAVVFSLIKTDHLPMEILVDVNDDIAIEYKVEEKEQKVDIQDSYVDRLSSVNKRIVGISLSVFSGVLYGQVFTAEIYEQGIEGHSNNALDYVFATFTGIFISSSFYFFIYCILKRNKPDIYPKVIVPGLVSGIMWGIATACWFVTNKALSEPVAFPIMTTLPAVMASFVGTFVFKEIRGRTNMLKLFLGFAVATTGAILSALSKTGNSSC